MGELDSRNAGPFGYDFTGPDDFDIPFPGEFADEFVGNRETFTWKDREGVKHKLEDIGDSYLQNIIGFLRKRLRQMELFSAAYWSEVIVFLEEEQRIRSKEGKEVRNESSSGT